MEKQTAPLIIYTCTLQSWRQEEINSIKNIAWFCDFIHEISLVRKHQVKTPPKKDQAVIVCNLHLT